MDLFAGSTASIMVDVAIVFTIFISLALGWSKGFLASVFSFVRWIVCIIASVFLANPAKNWLCQHTGLDESITSHLTSSIASALENNTLFSFVPEHFRLGITDATQETANRIMGSVVDTIILTVSFAIILGILLILTKLLIMVLESKDKDDAIGFINGLCGSVFGFLRGLLIVSLIMLILFPLLSFFDSDSTSPLLTAINESLIGSILYNQNPLTIILDAI